VVQAVLHYFHAAEFLSSNKWSSNMNNIAAKTPVARLRLDLKVFTRIQDGSIQVEGLPSAAGSRFDCRGLRADERTELAAAILGGKKWVAA
jgi:hypothetical protein